MNDHVFHQPPKESNRAALILSVLVHLILVGALFYGVQWSNNTSADAGTMMEVEVWNGKPSAARLTPPPPPPPPVVDTPPPPPPPPPKTPEKVEKAPEVTPDILIKDEEEKRKKIAEKQKQEEAKRKEDEKRKLDEEKKRKEDEQKRKEDEKRKLDEEKKRKEDELKRKDDEKRKQEIDNKLKAESQRLASEKEARIRAENAARLSAQLNAEMSGAARGKGLADYYSKIQAKIRGNVILPVGVQGNPEAVFDVVQLPTGEILSVKLKKSSGNAALDAAVERAITKSSPLPRPDAKENFKRELEIVYRPREE